MNRAAPPSPALAVGEFETSLPLRHAGMRRVRLRFECHGPAHAPLLLVAGGISAHRQVATGGNDGGEGWWEAQAGAGRALDTRRFRLLAIDWLGADGALDAPIDTADQADAIAAVLEHLGESGVQAFVGCSYGAMVGLQFAARHPRRLARLVAISGAHRPHPYASAWRALQRNIVRSGVAAPEVALSLARQLAMLSYRTPEEFAVRFAELPRLERDVARCGAEDYLAACGERYIRRWSATAFLRLSESIDLHLVDPAAVRVPTTLVAVSEDRLVPSADLYELGERLGAPWRLHHLRSRYGHDAFLKETDAIAAILREALADAGRSAFGVAA